jgi:hypothetical protein
MSPDLGVLDARPLYSTLPPQARTQPRACMCECVCVCMFAVDTRVPISVRAYVSVPVSVHVCVWCVHEYPR